MNNEVNLHRYCMWGISLATVHYNNTSNTRPIECQLEEITFNLCHKFMIVNHRQTSMIQLYSAADCMDWPRSCRTENFAVTGKLII